MRRSPWQSASEPRAQQSSQQPCLNSRYCLLPACCFLGQRKFSWLLCQPVVYVRLRVQLQCVLSDGMLASLL